MSTTAADSSSRTTTAFPVPSITAPAILSVPGTYRFPRNPCARGEDAEQGAASARVVGPPPVRLGGDECGDIALGPAQRERRADRRLDDGGFALAIGLLRRADDEERGEQREPQQPGRGSEQDAESAVLPPIVSQLGARIGLFATRPILRCVEESGLGRGQVRLRRRTPVEGVLEPDAAIEVLVPSAVRFPCVGRHRQLAEQVRSRGVLLEPVMQARPGEGEEFVRHGDGVVGCAQESRPYEAGHDCRPHRVVVQHGRLRIPAQGLSVWAELDEPEQRRPAGIPLRGGQVVEQLLGGPGDRTGQSSDVLVARDRQDARLTSEPRLDERMGEQRECGAVPGGVAEDQLRQAGLEPQPGPPRRLLDRGAKVLFAHRADEVNALREQGRERWLRGAFVQEVGPHCRHHDP